MPLGKFYLGIFETQSKTLRGVEEKEAHGSCAKKFSILSLIVVCHSTFIRTLPFENSLVLL